MTPKNAAVLLSLTLSVLTVFSATSCASQNSSSDRSPAESSAVSSVADSSESSSEDSITDISDVTDTTGSDTDSSDEEFTDPETAEQDLHSDFVVITKADELPAFMTNNKKLYADLLENILKLYYSGIVSGRINSDNYQHRYSTDELPRENSTPDKRREAAELCTVGGALEYYGYDNQNYMKYYEMYNGVLPFFLYDKDANIYLDSEMSADNTYQMNGFSQRLYHIFKYCQTSNIERDAMTFVASEVSTIVKTYYQDLSSGKIHQKNYRPKYTNDTIPPQNADRNTCQSIADQATIDGAIDYAGFYTPYHGCIEHLGYNKKSDIFTLPDFTNPDIISIKSADTKISSLSSL